MRFTRCRVAMTIFWAPGSSIGQGERIAHVYGHFTYGHLELSRDQVKSEVQIFAWDVETNNYTSRQITVMHI